MSTTEREIDPGELRAQALRLVREPVGLADLALRFGDCGEHRAAGRR